MPISEDRNKALRTLLEERRQEIVSQIEARMRDVRPNQSVLDPAESCESEFQDEIEFALIQMKAETLNKLEEALARLEDDKYGYCFECGHGISEPRLRAIPFAVRCKTCEEEREAKEMRRRVLGHRGFSID